MYSNHTSLPPNTACTRTPARAAGAGGGSLRVFKPFAWLEAGSGKMALSRPAHQRVTQTVGRNAMNVNYN
jgi:hypothetical protein